MAGSCQGNKDSKTTLSKLGCRADRFVDQLNMTQATIRAMKSGDSMLNASLRVQLFYKERNLNGNLTASDVGLTFSILNPSLSRKHSNCDLYFEFQCM